MLSPCVVGRPTAINAEKFRIIVFLNSPEEKAHLVQHKIFHHYRNSSKNFAFHFRELFPI